MATHHEEHAFLCQANAAHETDYYRNGPKGSCACSRTMNQLRCSGIILACGFVLVVSVAHLKHIGGFFGALKDHHFSGASADLVTRPDLCCSAGPTGQICLPGDPTGVCCGTDVALWCGAGSTCYTNTFGSPYCCAPNTIGCQNVCLDLGTSIGVIQAGGSCNPVAPQGFNADGRVMPVEAPWDASSLTYRLDGNQFIFFIDPPIRLGTGDFTMAATITPRVDGQVGFPSFAGGEIQPAVLYVRERLGAGTGYVVLFNPTQGRNTTATVVLGRDAGGISLVDAVPPFQTGTVQMVTVNISNIWQANAPVSFKIIRQGLNISVFVNNSLANVVPEGTVTPSEIVDVDNGLGPDEALFISPPISSIIADRTDLNADIADMSILSSACFP